MPTDDQPALKPPPLPLFAIFELPYGMAFAVTGFIPMILLRNAGLSIERAGAINSLVALPMTFYFLYAPVVDFFLRRRTWLACTMACMALLTGIAIAVSGSMPVAWVTVILFSSIVCAALVSAASGGLMGSLLTPEGKSRVGAWSQTGNLGGTSLFFGALLLLQVHLSRTLLGVLTAALMLLPVPLVLSLRDRPLTSSGATFGASMRGTLHELRVTLCSARRLPGILLLVSPIGSGAVSTVLSGMTRAYGITAAQLAFANGWGGGLVTAAGSLCLLLFPARWNRLVSYAVAGSLYGCISLLIGLAPLRPSTLVVGLLASNFAQGAAFAAYTGVVLHTMGNAGRLHSSRCAILGSFGNAPIVYMTAVLSWVAGHFSVHSVALADGMFNVASAAIFFAWFAWMRRRSSRFFDEPATFQQTASYPALEGVSL